ncbi:MAG: M61 family metallopeptidase [Janthinobacterium lividum]
MSSLKYAPRWLALALCAGLGPAALRAQTVPPRPRPALAKSAAKAKPAAPALPKPAAKAPGGPAKAAPAVGPAVRYAVAFPNAAHHEARVTATFAGLPPGPLRVRMARSSPGRYAQHDFIKNVYYVVATDGAGHPLPTARPDAYGWDVTPGPDGAVVFHYTLYANRSDGTYAGIDPQHAHLNAPAVFCYALGLENRPVEVQFNTLPDWKIATQLRPAGEKNTFSAPNWAYLMDSPTMLGPQQVRTWDEDDQTIALAVMGPDAPAAVDAYQQRVQQVVKEEKAIFGELPTYDFGRYTFLANYLPQATSDGMEHRNSTSLTAPRDLQGANALRNLGTVAHEFFHAWNVKRLRPKDLEPFDFQRTNMSDALWLAEGFTQYYGELALRRTRNYDDAAFFDKVSTWVSERLNSPGARYTSAVGMSQQAVFTDSGASIDPVNTDNTYLSYYYYGAGLALALDLELRRDHRATLDQYMQALWQQYGKKQANFAPVRPYTLPDLQRVLGEVAHDTAYAGQFFRRYVYGHEQPRFAEDLQAVGLAAVPTHQLALGEQVGFDPQGRCLVASNALIGSGLYKAGLDVGDQLVALDDKPLRAPADLDAVLRRHAPNQIVSAQVRTPTGAERSLQLLLNETATVQVQRTEADAKTPLAPAQQALRDAWLASQVR